MLASTLLFLLTFNFEEFLSIHYMITSKSKALQDDKGRKFVFTPQRFVLNLYSE
tara:strand:+ start:757 stop:918 length:162 start_codon:yes stop_codon:yes gene_type:complete